MLLCRPPIHDRRFDCHEVAGGLETRASIDIKLNFFRPPIFMLPRQPWKLCATRVIALLNFGTSYDVSTQWRANRLQQLTSCETQPFWVSTASHIGVN